MAQDTNPALGLLLWQLKSDNPDFHVTINVKDGFSQRILGYSLIHPPAGRDSAAGV